MKTTDIYYAFKNRNGKYLSTEYIGETTTGGDMIDHIQVKHPLSAELFKSIDEAKEFSYGSYYRNSDWNLTRIIKKTHMTYTVQKLRRTQNV